VPAHEPRLPDTRRINAHESQSWPIKPQESAKTSAKNQRENSAKNS